ncbi:DUF4215 domain-containing protein, partial [Candidatus Woesearchaeota archaeon]|nr:DUF4215 domain-containing protein [Candidatus Woesearchaeota archaeon]
TDLIWSTYDCPDGMFCNDGACVDTKVFTILPGKSTTISVNHKNFNLKHEVEGYDDDDSFHNLIIKDSSGSTVSSWQVYHEDSDYYTDTNENNKEKKFSQSAFGVYDLIIKITDSEKISGTYKVKQREVVCGNNVIEKEKGEECDNGDQNSDTASCTKACKINVCGDKLVYENIEECDDGNKVDGDGCQANCKNPVCGDNIKDAGEACDTGSQNSNTVKDACRTDCEIASCGDFVIDTGETCDDGTFNGDPNKCNVQCSGTTTGTCGNGVKEGAEECDLGESGDYYNDDLGACTTKCKNHKCGDGLVASGFEQCDDGNTVSGDGCSSSCVDETTYGDLVAPTGIDIQDVLAVVDHIIDKNAQLTGEKLKAANVVGCKTANPVANDIDIQDVLALVDAILDKKASIICSG